MDVKEKILDAIQLLASNTVKKAGYDKTIQAQIVSCEDATIGKYRCRYQDSIFYAYSNNSDLSFSNGSYVYILIPQNNFQKEKTILGTTEKLGINYISSAEGDEAYEQIGISCINSNTYYLNSNNINYEYTLYKYNGDSSPPTIDSDLSLDQDSLNQYIKESSSLIAGATFKTSIPAQKQFRGHYGIVYNLTFHDNASGQQVTRSYEINEDNMVDNPYRLAYPTRQYQIFDIDGENFIRVDSIAIFSRDFPEASSNTTGTKLNSGDIQITNLELTGAMRLSEEQINGVAITFYTPYGTFFTDSSVSTDTKTITAQVKVKGKLVSSVQKIPFYWGKENVQITPSNKLYNKQLGRGWQCLNKSNIVSEVSGENPVVEWIAGSDTIQVKYSQATAKDNRYKVAIIYDNTVITKQIDIKNLAAAAADITITSDTGQRFYYDIGSPTLTCHVDIGGIDQTNNCVFYWAFQSNTGVFSELPQTTSDNTIFNNAYNSKLNIESQINSGTAFPNAKENELNALQATLNSYKFIQRVQGNVVHNVQIGNITNFGTFKCSVFNKNNPSQYYGTGSITLTNTYEGEDLYSLVINNGTVTFQYNENGIAPTNGSLDSPQQIQALSFTVYDNLGQPIDSQIIANSRDCSIEWGFPIENTLLKAKDDNGEDYINGDPDRTDATRQYIYYKNNLQLMYDISKKYDIKKQVNQITLNVNYKGMNLTTQTQFTFAKQGEPGTNGTQYIVKLVPNIRVGQKPPLFPMITTTAQGQHFLNYEIKRNSVWNSQIGTSQEEQLFRAQLWHSGDLVWEGCEVIPSTPIAEDDDVKDGATKPTAIHWQILKNKYTSSVSDESDFEVSEATRGFIRYKGTHLVDNYTSPRANIIKCSITWDGKLYYGTIPIVTAWVSNNKYRVSLKDYTGFRYVIYTSDGMTPQYDNSHPFEFICEEVINNIKEDVSLVIGDHAVEYSFETCGNIYTKVGNNQAYRDQNLLQILTQDYYRAELTKNQTNCRPKSRYDGQCLNVAILCQYTQGGSVIGKINVPIHYLLNKYGLANINQWDGNSVQVNKQGGYILAPQMGAGFKDANNNFTGVLMGQVKVADKSNPDTGLLGYSEGDRTFFVNSDNGSAIFGKSGIGQIIIDPQGNRALLYSSNFWENYNADTGLPIDYNNNNVNSPDRVIVNINPTIPEGEDTHGMLIDLTTPGIYFGSGNFSVDYKGHLIAKGGGSIGGWEIADFKLYSQNKTLTLQSMQHIDQIEEDGSVTTVDIPASIYSNKHYALTNTSNGFYLSQNGLSIGKKFKVTNEGVVTIGNNAVAQTGSNLHYWKIDSTQGKEYTVTVTPSSGQTYTSTNKTVSSITYNAQYFNDTGNNPYNSVYIGTNGITLGKHFSVDNNGRMRVLRGRIQMGNTIVQAMETDGTPKVDNNGDPIYEVGSRSKFLIDTTTGEFELNINKGNINFGNGKFTVNQKGYLTATSGKIGGFFIGDKYLVNPKTIDEFIEVDTTDPAQQNKQRYNSVYVGIDGIALGKNFSVDNTGEMKIRSGSIALGANSTKDPPWNFYVDTNGNMTARSGEIGGIRIFSNQLLAGQQTNVGGVTYLDHGISLQSTGLLMGGPLNARWVFDPNSGKFQGSTRTGGSTLPNTLTYSIQAYSGMGKFNNIDVINSIGFGSSLRGFTYLTFADSNNTGTQTFQINSRTGQLGITGGIHGYTTGNIWDGNQEKFWISAGTGQAKFTEVNTASLVGLQTMSLSGIPGYPMNIHDSYGTNAAITSPSAIITNLIVSNIVAQIKIEAGTIDAGTVLENGEPIVARFGSD